MNTQLFYTICLSFILTSAFCQSNTKTLKSTNLSKIQSYVFTIPADGTYTAKILSPNGELVSSPIHQREFKTGEALEFKYKPTYFSAGKYQIVISNERQDVKRSAIIIQSNRAEQLRREKERYKIKKKE